MLRVSDFCRNGAGETCAQSTITPSRFNSRTTARPNSVRPPWRGASVALSTQTSVPLRHNGISRAPAACQTRSGDGPTDDPQARKAHTLFELAEVAAARRPGLLAPARKMCSLKIFGAPTILRRSTIST
jgi:hypothetical protein